MIRTVASLHEARLGRRDEFGQRYTLDFTLEWQNKGATLRSGWIIEHDSDIPRLTTCYPLSRLEVVRVEIDAIRLLNVIALTVDLPDYNLCRGQIGTVVETLAGGTAFEVEFSDRHGRTYESVGLRPEQLMVLHFEPASTWKQ